MFTVLGLPLPPHFLLSVSALAVPPDSARLGLLKACHLTLRTLSPYLSEKLPLTKLLLATSVSTFTDPKATHDLTLHLTDG